ncbi:hypothetical protein T265_11941 [Opisthorchis viverrini]|uniref:Uncharacterized protein n=1 Tax=Opisthorchis viverrini TaxID=6198 RepID=A0A074YWR2_OPIVI|nr:hypothetical protein T265_11941 [Opisthorchis viverrini]KER19211.1 hypothetical protein T265_11941 [Opisthorchis viverrini]
MTSTFGNVRDRAVLRNMHRTLVGHRLQEMCRLPTVTTPSVSNSRPEQVASEPDTATKHPRKHSLWEYKPSIQKGQIPRIPSKKDASELKTTLPSVNSGWAHVRHANNHLNPTSVALRTKSLRNRYSHQAGYDTVTPVVSGLKTL